jgi:hypothetical protein
VLVFTLHFGQSPNRTSQYLPLPVYWAQYTQYVRWVYITYIYNPRIVFQYGVRLIGITRKYSRRTLMVLIVERFIKNKIAHKIIYIHLKMHTIRYQSRISLRKLLHVLELRCDPQEFTSTEEYKHQHINFGSSTTNKVDVLVVVLPTLMCW